VLPQQWNGLAAGPRSGVAPIARTGFGSDLYGRDVDVLHLHGGDPGDAVDFDGTLEGEHGRYGPGGSLIGLTILNARLRLEQDAKIELTLPRRTVTATGLGDVVG
jgi:hypothetical protein